MTLRKAAVGLVVALAWSASAWGQERAEPPAPPPPRVKPAPAPAPTSSSWLVVRGGRRIQARGRFAVVENVAAYYDWETGEPKVINAAVLDLQETYRLNLAVLRGEPLLPPPPPRERFVIDNSKVRTVSSTEASPIVFDEVAEPSQAPEAAVPPPPQPGDRFVIDNSKVRTVSPSEAEQIGIDKAKEQSEATAAVALRNEAERRRIAMDRKTEKVARSSTQKVMSLHQLNDLLRCDERFGPGSKGSEKCKEHVQRHYVVPARKP